MEEKFSFLGYTDFNPTSLDLPYLGKDEAVLTYSPLEITLINGIGSTVLPIERCKIYRKFKELGYSFYSVIHSGAILSPTVHLSEGVQIMAGVILNAKVFIGENTILNTGAIVDHDGIIGAHTHIAPRATISGGVKIGEGCHIGTGATLIQGITIGSSTLIGAGSVVLNNMEPYSKVIGSPAKVVERWKP